MHYTLFQKNLKYSRIKIIIIKNDVPSKHCTSFRNLITKFFS